ncbi:protein PML-like isoform X2 [Leucoraja erinacea]|uniref:protein PML-like isoform X2 n=1 Tax=Leucoraja erinaceus TaxID=7782 RepID=UPI0024584F6D|nr:protein PML-like isoform X2 [Leucoraja erinacea]
MSAMEPGSDATLSGESVMCGVCCNQLRRPKLLPCLHSVCLECLQNVWVGQDFAICPICSAPTDGDITKVQDNTLLAKLVSKVQLQQRIDTGLDIWCSICQTCGSEEPATFLCFTCDHFLCLRCFHGHQLLIEQHGHTVKSLENLKALSCEEFAILSRNERQATCPEHKDQQISFFCKTCSTSACCNCLLLHHTPQGHLYHDIKQEVRQEGEALKQMVDATQQTYSRFADSHSELMTLEESMNLRRNEIEAAVKHQAFVIEQEIIGQGCSLKRELEDICKLELSRLANRLRQTEQMLHRMEAGHKLADFILRLGTNNEMKDMIEPIRSGLMAMGQAMPFDSSKEVTSMEFRECPLEVKNLLGTFPLKREHGEEVKNPENEEERREEAKDPENEESPQEASGKVQVESSLSMEDKSAPDSQSQHQSSEHSYSVSNTPPQLPSSTTTENGILNISSDTGDEWQQPAAEESIMLSSDDSEDDGIMVVDSSETAAVLVHPESSKDPTDHRANNGSGWMNGDLFQEGSSGMWQCQKLRGHPVVFFQIKTTDVGDDDIVHLAAVSGEKVFNDYIMPCNPNLADVATARGFRVVDGVLYLHGECLPACSLQYVMDSFLHFLQQLEMPVLAGYGIWNCDSPTLCRVWERLSMKNQFAQCISGFLDILWLAEKIVPKSMVKNYQLKHLVSILVGELEVCNEHTLRRLYVVLQPSLQQAEDSQFTLSQLECHISLQTLIKCKVISRLVADKLALQNISLKTLEVAYCSNPRMGLKNLMQASRNLGLSDIDRIIRNIREFLCQRAGTAGKV